jgi:hypothetical protein
MYTDPSGEVIPFLVAVAIGAGVAALTYTLTAVFADVPFTVGGLVKATFIGAASAAVTFGIGTAAGNLFGAATTFSKAAFQALAHGTFQGTMSGLQGGNFWTGFAAGALSSIASSAFSWDGNGAAKGLGWGSSVRDSGAGMIAFGTVSGGAGAALTGGNFWQGAVTGLVVSGLNHGLHKMRTSQQTRTYSLPATASSPDGNLPIHQQADPTVGCTQEVLESIVEYKTGQILNLDKSAGADFVQLAGSDAVKSLNLSVSRAYNSAHIIGTNMVNGNPSVITYDNGGVQHTVAINKITITQTTNARGVISFQTTIQVMNPLNSTYQTLPMSSFNNGVIRTVKF